MGMRDKKVAGLGLAIEGIHIALRGRAHNRHKYSWSLFPTI
jgi:hypothetical protein